MGYAKAVIEVGLNPSRPLYYWAHEMNFLPRNTRNCIRYLGDYIDLLTKEMTHEFLNGNARKNSLGRNTNLLTKKAPQIKVLANLLNKYSSLLYTPGKHDFNLPQGREHRFTPEEVIFTCYLTAELGRRILSVSKLANIAVKNDNQYSIGGRWGSHERVQYQEDLTKETI